MKALRQFLLGLTLVIAQPLAADPAPGFDLPGDAGQVTLEALKGRVVYLDFWASWCPPCRESFPWMANLQRRYGKRGLSVVAVNLDKDHQLAERFLAEQQATFTIAYDPSGETAGRYHVMGMPSSYLIDRTGRIVQRHVGFREADKDKLEDAIRSLLEGNGQ